MINTPSHLVDHLSRFDLSFDLHHGAEPIRLHLEPNEDILAGDAVMQYIDDEGNVERQEPIERHKHRVFKGTALHKAANGRWIPVGWARIYLKQDGLQPLFEGAFSVAGNHHHIELQSTYMETRRSDDVDVTPTEEDSMVVYRDSDMIRYVHSELKRSFADSSSCEADKLGFNSGPQHPIFQSNASDRSQWGAMGVNSLFGLSKRQSDVVGVSGNTGTANLQATIGDTTGCPSNKKVALIGVALDCWFVKAFEKNKRAPKQSSTPEEKAREHVISVVNSASDLYERSFNISIGLRNLTTGTKPGEACPQSPPSGAQWNMPCTSGNITTRLDLFSKWRGSRPDNNAYWTMMTGCNFGSEVGLSWLGQLCNTEVAEDGNNFVSGTNIVARAKGGWQVFAHESGHTFGAVHDCTARTCAEGDSLSCCPLSAGTCIAGGDYIMNPSTGEDVTGFSPCTIGNICSALGRNSVKSGCLSDNQGVVTYTGGQCGNGIVEVGEDCDCGGQESCASNSCCDGNTCKFKGDAVCDDANESCCTNCHYAPADTVCRASTGECDHQETCTGNSSSCPPDEHKPNGAKCGPDSKNLKCASGQCTSRDYQCQSLMGDMLNSTDVHACGSASCTVTCASSALAPNQCATMPQSFLDGTPCQNGGHCKNGQCKGSSTGEAIKSWIDKHTDVVIGIACGVGGVIVLSLAWCLINRCRRSRREAAMAQAASVHYGGGWPGAMPGPSPMGGWGAPPSGGYRGLNTDPPPYPVPVYGRYA